jgi:hypothetical protein
MFQQLYNFGANAASITSVLFIKSMHSEVFFGIKNHLRTFKQHFTIAKH